jgi:glutamyl-tRNA synthetase
MRGRFAPSPTGRLHLGNARTAFLAWLQVRAAGGSFLLRVEDLDRPRCRAAYLDDLFRDLEYLGLTWDEEPLYQSRRGEAYRDALERLRQLQRTYECFCSRSEIARAASAPHGPADEGPRYPGTCADLPPEVAAERRRERAPALRFRSSSGTTQFTDRFRGTYAQDVSSTVGDFVVQRNDGTPSYQLAVVVDDAQSAISDVLRADDLLASTPRQLQLYRALGLKAPSFAHIPLLIEPGGSRLAKREGVFAIAELRAARVPPERVLGLLASWSGLGNDEAPARDWVGRFSLERIPRSAVPVDEAAIKRRLKTTG